MGDVVPFTAPRVRVPGVDLLEGAHLIQIGLARFASAESEAERSAAARFVSQAAYSLHVLQAGLPEASDAVRRIEESWRETLAPPEGPGAA